MNHNENKQHLHRANVTKYSLKVFLPLIIIFSIIFAYSIIHQILLQTRSFHIFMNDFMGAFFIVFGFFKLINLRNFAQAYSTYDLIAKHIKIYAYIYPFIELGLGISYLMRWSPFLTNLVTLIVMLVSALGVFNELRKKQAIVCACLGVIFKIPMTYVTLIEDLLMALMALIMLFL